MLDLGYGLCDDAFRMAARVGPHGLVLRVDASTRLISAAVNRLPAGLRVRFTKADAHRLPFRDGSLDRCRVDRTSLHIANPRQAIRELVRVLRPGGALLAYDNDWGTFSVSGRNDEATKIIAAAWEESLTNPWIGRYLKLFFLEAGLQQVALEPSVSVLTDFEIADRVYNLRQTLARSVAASGLAPAVAEDWLSDVKAKSRSGGFLCTLTAYTVLGTRPAP